MTIAAPLAFSGGGRKTVSVGTSGSAAPSAPGAPSGQSGMGSSGAARAEAVRSRESNKGWEFMWVVFSFGGAEPSRQRGRMGAKFRKALRK